MEIQHIGTKVIETDRLILRRFQEKDAKVMFKNWVNDIDVCKFLSWKPHEKIEVTQEILEKWITSYENNNTYNWAIVLKEIGEVIGSISAININDKHFNCEIGYCIGKEFWSKGITTEALKAIIKFFFDEIGLNRIQAQHDTQNVASGKVMKKSGMILEGIFRQKNITHDGSFVDCNVWAIIRDDYLKNRL